MSKIQSETKTAGDLETLETFFQKAHEEVKLLRIELDTIVSDIEKMDRNIAKAEEEAEKLLAEYRTCLHQGEKVQADSKLDLVSKKRKSIKVLKDERTVLVKKAAGLSDRKEKIHKQICEQSSSEVFKNLLSRTNKLLVQPGQCFGNLLGINKKITAAIS